MHRMPGTGDIGIGSDMPMTIDHDYRAIVRVILDDYALHPEGYHGVYHWARVYENGHRLATALDADPEVVRLFALFHDARRFNEDNDPEHGKRGGDLAWSLRGSLVHVTDVMTH